MKSCDYSTESTHIIEQVSVRKREKIIEILHSADCDGPTGVAKFLFFLVVNARCNAIYINCEGPCDTIFGMYKRK
jgi:hypothetical protein